MVIRVCILVGLAIPEKAAGLSSGATMAVQVNANDLTTLAPMHANSNVMEKSLVRCARLHATFDACTRSAAGNAMNLVHHAPKRALGLVRTEDVVRCLAPFRVTFFLARKDVRNNWPVDMRARLSVARNFRPRGSVRPAAPRTSRL